MTKKYSISTMADGRLKKYRKAYEEFSGVKNEEYKIKEDWPSGPALVKHKDDVYRIASEEDMYNHFKQLLTDEEEACLVHLGYWIWVAENVHLEPRFIGELYRKLDNKEQIETLNIALNFCSCASGGASVFWNTLFELDDYKLYPKAIIAACETYDFESMLEDYMSYIIEDGENQFPELVGGTFETVELGGSETKVGEYFYLYTVDPMHWNIKD